MSKKHYIITAVTLGLIAATSAGLIGVANLITRDQIAKNEYNKTMSGIASIFEGAEIEKEYSVQDFKYVNYVYELSEDTTGNERYIFKTTGSNSYGKISLLVGIKEMSVMDENIQNFVFTNLYVITNEQSFATTLVDNYIDPLNNGDRDIDDVSCSATYGAKLVRDMINEAKEAATALFTEEK